MTYEIHVDGAELRLTLTCADAEQAADYAEQLIATIERNELAWRLADPADRARITDGGNA